MAKDKPLTQIEKFKDTARQLGADESDSAFDEKLRKIAKQKPAAKPEKKPSK